MSRPHERFDEENSFIIVHLYLMISFVNDFVFCSELFWIWRMSRSRTILLSERTNEFSTFEEWVIHERFVENWFEINRTSIFNPFVHKWCYIPWQSYWVQRMSRSRRFSERRFSINRTFVFINFVHEILHILKYPFQVQLISSSRTMQWKISNSLSICIL